MTEAKLVYIGVDESGRLNASTPLFTLAGMISTRPKPIQNIIRRVAIRTGKQLHRTRHAIGEFKWSNASQQFRQRVIDQIAYAQVEIVTLTVLKEGRQIEDTPENNAILICRLMSLCWEKYPKVSLLLDKHFTSAEQIAAMNTLIYRHWLTEGVLSIDHVDSQRNLLVQLADFVAGCVYDSHLRNDVTFRRLEAVTLAQRVEKWGEIKRDWIEGAK